MADICFEVDIDEDSLILEQRDIDRCEDPDLLLSWYDQLETKQADCEAQLVARRLCGTDDLDWLYSVSTVMAFSGMGMSRIKKRLRSMGVNPWNDRTVQHLQERLASQKLDAAFGRSLKRIVIDEVGGAEGARLLECARVLMIATERLPPSATDEKRAA